LKKESGCGGVFLGIESGDANVLKNMNKKAKIEHYRRGLKLPNNAMERTKCDVESVRIIKKIVVSKPKK
jgi:radical SAM superfamily enzyme YgiQ (UPF0313 family)